MSHADEAERIFTSGMNCCQAVVMAYAEELGLDREQAMRVGSAMGGGMGGMGLTCGAVTGALMVIGLKHPRPDRQSAGQSTQLAQELMRRFTETNKTTGCRELLGRDISTPEGHAEARAAGVFQTICPKMVRNAAEILDQIL